MAPKSRRKKAHVSAKVLKCYCDGHCPDNLEDGICETRPGGSCFSSVEEVYDELTGQTEPERTYGCMSPEQSGGLLQCKVSTVPYLHGKNIFCCDSEDFCNKNLHPKYTPRTTIAPPEQPIDEAAIHYLALIISMVVCIAAFVIVILTVYITHKRRERSRKQPRLIDSIRNSQTSPLADLVEQTSGSGSGLPLLVQRTIAKQIQMSHSVGKGRYGEVWLGKWHDENVAVKIFFTTEEASWFRETEIYQSVLMRHENILGFIAADIKGSGAWTQMILITDYHELGSLHDYLERKVLNAEMLYTMAFSLTSGLTHLHTEIFGSLGKPAIAHRDLKSKNIMIKRNGQCVIADFGMAVKYLSDTDEIQIAPSKRIGTIRYMAPEVLSKEIQSNKFESYKMADIYSMGLIFWEMARRCITPIRGTKNTSCEDYALPYHDVIKSDPTIEEMYQIVCVKRIRPPVPVRWKDLDILQILSHIMQECWHPNPAVRLTALRIQKSLRSKCDSSNVDNVEAIKLV